MSVTPIPTFTAIERIESARPLTPIEHDTNLQNLESSVNAMAGTFNNIPDDTIFARISGDLDGKDPLTAIRTLMAIVTFGTGGTGLGGPAGFIEDGATRDQINTEIRDLLESLTGTERLNSDFIDFNNVTGNFGLKHAFDNSPSVHTSASGVTNIALGTAPLLENQDIDGNTVSYVALVNVIWARTSNGSASGNVEIRRGATVLGNAHVSVTRTGGSGHGWHWTTGTSYSIPFTVPSSGAYSFDLNHIGGSELIVGGSIAILR